VLPEEDDLAAANWPATFGFGSAANPEASAANAAPLEDDPPILVIEEDSSEPPGHRPQAQRREYRDLFSRLRSG
jgi:hypothetical protein